MKLNRTHLLMLTLVALWGGAIAADVDFAGNPMTKDGALWARKAGTTNTKQDVTSTSNALDVNIASGSMTPPTGTSATQVQGTAADGAAAVGKPVQMAGVDGSSNAQVLLTGTDGRLSVNTAQVGGTTVSTGNGTTDAGTQRVSLSSDSTGLVKASNLPTTVDTNNGAASASSLRVTIASDSTGQVKTTNWPTTVDTGNGATSASTPRVTLSNDSTGTVIAQGNVASDAPFTANPLPMGGRASAANPTSVSTDGDAVAMWMTLKGSPVVSFFGTGSTPADGVSASGAIAFAPSQDSSSRRLGVFPYIYNGTSIDTQRSAGIGNSVASTGILAAAPYGEYLTLANQPAPSTGQYGDLQTDSVFNIKTTQGAPAIGNILVGRQTFTSTTGATTLVTITAGKSVPSLKLVSSVSCAEAAAATVSCQANATFTTVGAGMTPAAGTVFACDAKSGANAATGTVGSEGNNFCAFELPVSCASGTCTIAVASTNAGTSSLVEASASGIQQ